MFADRHGLEIQEAMSIFLFTMMPNDSSSRGRLPNVTHTSPIPSIFRKGVAGCF